MVINPYYAAQNHVIRMAKVKSNPIIIGATTMGTGGDKSPQLFGWRGPAMYWSPPQLLVITFSIMHEMYMKHARCIVMRQRSMQYRPISFDTFVILGNELHASALCGTT